MKRRLKRIAPLQLGKILALLYGVFGLVLIPLLLLTAFVGPKAGAQGVPRTSVGVGVILLVPMIYAVVGFICGVVGAALYNLVARWVGGIEVEVEDSAASTRSG